MKAIDVEEQCCDLSMFFQELQIYIEEFLPKVLSERSTIVVVDNKGDTMGYITEKELAISLSKTAHQK